MTLMVFTGVFVVPQYALQAAPEIPAEVQPPDPASRPGEVTFGFGILEHEIDESVDTIFPLAVPKNGLLFFNPKLSLSDRMNPSVSLGLGYRHLFEGPKIIVGGSLFYDSYVSENDHHYNQFGVGAEVLSRWVDWRANYYLPEQNRRKNASTQTLDISRKATTSSTPLGPQGTSDSLSFVGHNIQDTMTSSNRTLNTITLHETETTRFWEQYESGMRGLDTEMGFLIPGLDRYAETRIFGGYYFFENPFGKNISGFKSRVEIRALPAVTFDAAYYADKEVIGSNWYYGVRVSAPFDLANIAHHKSPFAGFGEAFKPKNTAEQDYFNSRLTENIIRTSRVSLAQSKFIPVREKKEVYNGTTSYITGTASTSTTILTLGGAPITLTHADSAAAVPGDGTFETPYNLLSLADGDAVKRDIVYLHADGSFTGSITLAAGQQLLGDSKTGVNLIQTDQLGTIPLPHASAGVARPILTNPGGAIVNVVSNNVVSNLTLDTAARGVYAAAGASNVTVSNSTIQNMTTTGIEIKPSTSSTITGVTFINNNQDVILNASDTTITNVTSTGATNGSIQLLNTTGTTTLTNVAITNAGGFGLQVSNPGGTHNITNLDVSGGTGFGIDIEGGTGGTFVFDSTSSVTNTGGAAFRIFGGAANVTYNGDITQGMNAPAVAVLGGHTGTATFQTGTVSSTAGQGLLFDNANGTYNFLGTTTLTNGANLQILNNSAGSLVFGTAASIVNGSGQDVLVNDSTANLTYSGSITESAGTLLQVNNHSTGTIQFDTGTLSATGGNGLQFNNADGIYKFLGTATLAGGAAAVDIVSGSDGTFAFDTATTITNPTATAFFVNGGASNITYSGNITANTGFALQVLNHSTGTIAFNTGNITETGGNGVQFVADSGIYSLADTRVTGSGGSAIEVVASPTGNFTFGTVALNNSASSAVNLNNAGTVKILGGTIDGAGGNGIFSQNTALTATGLTLGGNHATTISGIGVQIINNDGTARTVTVSNDDIRSNGAAILTTDGGNKGELTLVLDANTLETLAGGAKAMSITGGALNSTIVKSMNAGQVIANGTGGGVLFNRVTFDASGTALAGTQVNAGNWSIGQGTAAGQRVLNDGLHFDGPTGNLAFGTLNIFNNAGTGLFVDTKTLGTTFSLSNTGGVIDTTGGTAMNIDPLTTNLTFTSVTSANSGGAGVIANGLTSGSTLTIGTTTVTASGGNGVVVQNSNGAIINFGTTTVTNAGGSGIDLTQAGGASVTFGTTLITTPGASGINMSNAAGTFIFGATTINGTAAGQTAFNLNGANADVTALSLDINGGGIGIDLRNTINGHTVAVTNGGTIQNVGVGVQLGGGVTGNFAQSANAFFTFDVTGGHNSTISGTVAIEARGLVSTASNVQGTYDFRNVTNLVGSQNFEPVTGTPFFVANTAHGSGDGSTPGNASTFAGIAGTAAGAYIVLVNDGSDINLGAATITLKDNDHVDTFGGGRTFAGGTAPVNILLPGVPTYTDPFGNGAATVTGSGTLFIAANGDLLQNFTMTLGGGTGISASGVTSLTVTSVTIGGTGNVFDLTNMAGSVNLTNNTINVSGGNLLNVNGGNATINLTAGTGSISNTGGSGVSVINTTGGSITITGVSVTGATSTPLVFDNNKATFNITGSTFAANAGVTLLDVDTGAGGSTQTLAFNNTNTLTHTSGTIATIGAGARNIDLSAQSFTNSGTTAANVIKVVGQTGGTISFGSIGITGFNGAGPAVSLAGTAGTVNFNSGLNITTDAVAAFAATGAITLNILGAGNSLTTGGGLALSLTNTNIGTVNFNSIEVDDSFSVGTQGAVALNATTGGTMNLGTVYVERSLVDAISLQNVASGTYNFNGLLTVNSVGGAAHAINIAGAATGSAFNFANIDLSTIPTADAISLANNNLAQVAFTGGQINRVTTGDAIHSVNTVLTATGLSIGNNGAFVIGGNGIEVINNDGVARTVNLSNDNIKSVGDAIKTSDSGVAGELSLVLDGNTLQTTGGGSLAMNIVGSGLNSTTVNSMNGGTVTANGTGGGILFNQVTFDAVTGGAVTQVNAGAWNIGQGTAARVQGNGLNIQGPTGNLAFTTLNIFNDNGTGLLVNTKALGTTFTNLANTAGTVDTTNGAALNLDPLTVHLTFGSVTSTNAPINGVILASVGGTLALGDVSVTNATAAGLSMGNSNAAVTASSVTVNGAATGLLFGTNTGGSFTVSGATSLTAITGTGINATAATGTYKFAGLTIGYTGAGRGIDFRGSNVQFESDTTSITGNGTAGSIAIDLSGTLNPNGANSATPNILLANDALETATISNVATGVKMGDGGVGSAGAYFRFGNQTPLNSGSSIAVTAGGVTLDTTNLTSTDGFTQGRYEFKGVAFTGSASFQAAVSFFFVAATATGNADGTTVDDRADAATLLTALAGNALANKTIVLINDGNVITLANTANLDANTNIDGFGNGNSVAAFTIPVNVIIDTFTGTVADPTGNGAATLTTAGGHNLINLNGGNSIKNVTLSGGDFLVGGTTTGLTVQGNTLTSGALGVFSLTNPTGVITITNNTISGGGSLLTVNGGSAGISLTKGTGSIANTGGSGVNIANTTGGSVTLTGLSVTGATATPLTFDNNKAIFAITGSTFAVNAGVTLLNVDTNVGGSTQTLAFDNTNTLTQTSGTIATIGAGARNIDLSAFNFTNTGTTAANVIKSVGQTGGTISFGNINIVGYNNSFSTAVSLAGLAAGTVSFADLDIATGAGAALNVGAITFAPGSSSTISVTGIPPFLSALVMNGTTLSGGTATFASVSTSGLGGNPAISLTNTVGTTNFTTVSITGVPGASGIVLNKAGTTNILGGTIDGAGLNGIDSTNTTLTATGLTIGGTAAPSGNGIRVVNNDGIARVVTISNDNIKSAGDAIKTTDSGAAFELSLVLNGNTLQTTGVGSLAMNIAGSGLNSTTINSMNGVAVTANGTGGGLLFNRVTFDAVTGGAVTQVNSALSWFVGQGTLAGQRVQGNGVNFQGPTGDLSIAGLNIFNNNGTGLLVNTKTLVTTFSLGGQSGVDTTNGTALNLDPLTANLNFNAVKSTNASTSGVILDTVAGNVGFASITVTNATQAGLAMFNSSAAVTVSGPVTVTGAATGLQFGTNTGGSFSSVGAVSLTGITGTGIDAHNATGSYQVFGTTTIGFAGTGAGIDVRSSTANYDFADVVITYTGAGRGIDFRSSNLPTFSTHNLTITGDGVTAGSIALDLSGSLYPAGQPVPLNLYNIAFATTPGETAQISGVTTGVKLGDGTVGSAHAYLRYGTQVTPSSGSTIAVNAGGTTIDTTNLVTTSATREGRYEFDGVAFTGQATFELTNPNYIFVGSTAPGAGNGTSIANRITVAQLQTLDATPSNLDNKTFIFVNDGSINFGATTLTLGVNTVLEGFGNGATVVVPGGTQPANVIGTFTPGGGSFTDPGGAATLTANGGVNVITLSNGNTIQNININAGSNQIIGTNTAGFTLSGVNQTAAGASAISLTNSTGTIAMTGGSISGAAAPAFNISGGTAVITYGGTLTQNSAATAVQVTGKTGGSVTFSGLVTANTSTATAINLTTNTGATISFNAGLNIDTTSGTGFNATGGGTVNVAATAADESINSTAARALNLNGVTAGINFDSVSSTNSTTNGLTLISVAGAVTLGSSTATGSTAQGIFANLTTATVAFGNTNTGSTGAEGVRLESNPTGTFSFGTLTINNAGSQGFQHTNDGGATTVTGATSITNTTAQGLVVQGTTVGHDVVFANVTVSGTGGTGVLLGQAGLGNAGNVTFGTLNITPSVNQIALASTASTGTITTTGGTITATGTGSAIVINGPAGLTPLNLTFTSVNSAGGTNGISLTNTSGTLTVGGGGTLTGASGATFNVVGGTVAVTYSGNITQANNAALVSISGGHATGTIAFDGTLSATNGTGVQFDNADGTYTFNTTAGSTTLNGGDAGVDILNGSSGSFTFGRAALPASFVITNPTGTGFVANGSTAGVTYNGNITKSGASVGLLVDITNESAGTITFQSGTLTSTSTAGTGINLNNADGTVNFNGTTTLNGGNSHVDINTGSGGTITFGTGTTITSASGTDFVFNGSTAGVTYSGSMTQGNSALMVDITNQASGTITFQTGTLSASAGTGINLNNVDGTVNFNGTTTLNGGNAHIDINTGSAGTITFASGASVGATTAPTGVDFREDTSTANVTYNGTLRQTNAANVVSVNAKTGGTTTFNGAIAASTGAANAITLTANTGGTINFTGGLSLTTTSGVGFNATGGGTVNATGANSTITSATGAALNIANTTIGASNVTFKSISSNGAASGIILDTTGSSGGLKVTGSGSATVGGDNSGGTIQNATIGIQLTNTQNVSFTNMNIQTTTRSGIAGTSVTNFTFANGTVNNSGSQNADANIAFNTTVFTGAQTQVGNNISGTLNITGSKLINGFSAGLDIQSDNGTVTNANVSNNIVTNPGAGTAALSFVGTGNATTAFNLNNATIANNTITGQGSGGIQVSIGNSNASGPGAHAGFVTFDGLGRPVSDPSHIISITGNSITAIDSTGTQAITVANSGGNSASRTQTNFEIKNNGTVGTPLGSSSIGTVILIGNNGFADMSGVVDNNVIVATQTPNLGGGNGIAGGNGVAGAGAAWTPKLNLSVTNNSISGTDGNGILLVARSTNGEFDLKIANNTVGTPVNAGGSARPGIRVDAGNGAAGEDAAVFLNIFGNTSSGSNGAGGIGVRKNGTVATTNDFGLYDAAGGPSLPASPTNTDITNFIDALNPGSTASFIINGSNFLRDTTQAPPLQFIPNGQSASTGDTLTTKDLNSLASAAISFWQASGLTEQQTALLQSLTFDIANLPAGYVGEALPGQVLLSSSAAGQSWFIDSTPLDNSEFTGTGTKLTANANSAAAGRVDAFTVVLHEVGHELGLDDTYLSSNSNSLMYGYITLGERRLPAANQAFGVTAPTGSFADALMIGAPAPASTGSSAWKSTVIIPQPIAPFSTLPKNIHTIDLPAQGNSAADHWIIPAFGNPNTIYWQPEMKSAVPTALEIDPAARKTRGETEAGTQSQNSSHQPVPLSSTKHGHKRPTAASVKLRDTDHAVFTNGAAPLANRLP